MKLEQFIKNNNLTFKVGRRNNDITIVCGYALHNNCSEEDIIKAINSNDSIIKEEVKRVYDYAKKHDYGNFWETEEAQNLYKF